MSTRGIVLYEDKMLPNAEGNYPLHDLVMRMVEDDINGETWRVRKLIDKNPRKGVDNIIKDLAMTSMIARAGMLFVLVDGDRVAEHLRLAPGTSEDAIVRALRERSDAPERLSVHLLQPNLEGLLRSIRDCAPTLLPEQLNAALRKKLNDRDIVLNTVKQAQHRSIRDCLRARHAGLDALTKALAAACG